MRKVSYDQEFDPDCVELEEMKACSRKITRGKWDSLSDISVTNNDI